MRQEICLISVPHNGTQFLRHELVKAGWADSCLFAQRRIPKPQLYLGHCVKAGQTMQAVELSRRMPVIMPLRHPYRVEESWKRRGYETQAELWQAYERMLTNLKQHVAV